MAQPRWDAVPSTRGRCRTWDWPTGVAALRRSGPGSKVLGPRTLEKSMVYFYRGLGDWGIVICLGISTAILWIRSTPDKKKHGLILFYGTLPIKQPFLRGLLIQG